MTLPTDDRALHAHLIGRQGGRADLNSPALVVDIDTLDANIATMAAFAAIEPIFRAAGGRPHWAKRHTLTARDVHELYPRAADFEQVRATIDPGAKFANPLMSDLFAIEAKVEAAA